MPSGPRIRANNSYGLTTDAPLTIGATTFNSAGLVTLPTVAAAHAIVTLDPLREFGEPEIVVVTAHTAAATVATITRGQYGTVARSHPVNTTWVHAPLDEDFVENVALTTEILDPYRGQMLFDRTLNRYVGREITDVWSNVNMLADPPACRVYHNANQSIADAVETTVAFNSERYDTAGMHDTVTNNSRVTIPVAGVYTLDFTGGWQVAADYGHMYVFFRLNGVTGIAAHAMNPAAAGGVKYISFGTTYKFAAGDYVEVRFYQDNTAGAARNLEALPNFSPEFAATWFGRG